LSSNRYYPKDFLNRLIEKPLSLFVILLALGLIFYAFYDRWQGNLFVARLDYVDSTTLIMVALLLLRAVVKLGDESDLQTVSIGLISALSFIFFFEMIYKLSFFIFPWHMPPGELREFVIQISVALVVIVGFAQGIFRFTLGSKIALGLFIAGWFFWMVVGFPQLGDGLIFYTPLIDIPFSWEMIYAMNRLTKFFLFMVYFLLYI